MYALNIYHVLVLRTLKWGPQNGEILPSAVARTDHTGTMLSLLYLRNSGERLLHPPLQARVVPGAQRGAPEAQRCLPAVACPRLSPMGSQRVQQTREERHTLGMKVKERQAWRGGQEPRKRKETGPTLGTEHEVIPGAWLHPLSPVLWRCPQGVTCLGGMFLLIVV